MAAEPPGRPEPRRGPLRAAAAASLVAGLVLSATAVPRSSPAALPDRPAVLVSPAAPAPGQLRSASWRPSRLTRPRSGSSSAGRPARRSNPPERGGEGGRRSGSPPSSRPRPPARSRSFSPRAATRPWSGPIASSPARPDGRAPPRCCTPPGSKPSSPTPTSARPGRPSTRSRATRRGTSSTTTSASARTGPRPPPWSWSPTAPTIPTSCGPISPGSSACPSASTRRAGGRSSPRRGPGASARIRPRRRPGPPGPPPCRRWAASSTRSRTPSTPGTAGPPWPRTATDYYPLPLARTALKPGTVYADPYGHTFVIVRWVPQTRKSPGPSPRRRRPARRDDRHQAVLEGELPVHDRGGRRRARVQGLPSHRRRGRPAASPDQPRDRREPRLRRLLARAGEDDARRFLRGRWRSSSTPSPSTPWPPSRTRSGPSTNSSSSASTRWRTAKRSCGPTRARSSPCLRARASSSRSGSWEDYSTPNRDLRLLIAIDTVLEFPDKAARNPEAYEMAGRKTPDDVRRELLALLEKRVGRARDHLSPVGRVARRS